MAKTQQYLGTQLSSQPERFPLIGTALWRDSSATKDQRFINCFQETLKNEVTNSYRTFVVKRPGMVAAGRNFGATPTGYFFWAESDSSYTVVGDTLYSNGVIKQVLNHTPTHVGFVEITKSGQKYLFIADGEDAWLIDDTNQIEQINPTYSAWQASFNYALGDRVIPTVANGYYYEVTTDGGSSGASQPTWPISIGSTVSNGGLVFTCVGEYGGFPSPHVPQPKFIDGYVLLQKSNTADIYNSDVDNPFGWGTGNHVSAEMWPDDLVAAARQNNMYVAFGQYSTEFFYDAALGTAPFARNEGVPLQIGCAAPWAIYENEKFCIFVGQSQSGGRAVWRIEGFQAKKVSTEHIERILDAEGNTIASATYGYGIRTKGHLFYVLVLSTRTLVYDVEENVWHEWTILDTGVQEKFNCIFATDRGDGSVYLMDTLGRDYKMNPTYFTDDGATITCDIYTAKYDGGTMNRKFMHNTTVVGDYQPTGVSLRWSDDDYTTWSNWKTLTGRNFFTRLGAFRRRAFNLRHEANSDFRAEALEFEVDVGTH